jgi:hypothetical protein
MGLCAGAAPRARLCAQPYAECFDCSALPDAGSNHDADVRDATTLESGIIDGHVEAGDARVPADGSAARDAEGD